MDVPRGHPAEEMSFQGTRTRLTSLLCRVLLWQPSPVFLPGESHGWRSLVGYSPWGLKGSDTTEVTEHAHRPIPWVSTPSGQPHRSQLTRAVPRPPPASQVFPPTGVGTRSPSSVCAVNSQGRLRCFQQGGSSRPSCGAPAGSRCCKNR